MRRLVVGGLAVISAAVLGLVLVLVARNHSSEASLPMFIFAGQSNMVGFGAHLEETSPALPTDDSRVLYWDESLRAWSARLPPAGSAGTFGPDVTALRRLADRLHEHVLAVKFAVNGSGLAYDWDPSRPDGLYARLRAAVADAIVAPVGRRWPKVNGFFWMQGERDGETPDARRSAFADKIRHGVSHCLGGAENAQFARQRHRSPTRRRGTSSGRQVRPSALSKSSAAAGPAPPDA